MRAIHSGDPSISQSIGSNAKIRLGSPAAIRPIAHTAGADRQDIGRNSFPPARSGHCVPHHSDVVPDSVTRGGVPAGQFRGLRGMDVRRGPVHNERGLHELAVTRS
jgi:hypothetical protein